MPYELKKIFNDLLDTSPSKRIWRGENRGFLPAHLEPFAGHLPSKSDFSDAQGAWHALRVVLVW